MQKTQALVEKISAFSKTRRHQSKPSRWRKFIPKPLIALLILGFAPSYSAWGQGVVNLQWNANPESNISGYKVLLGQSSGSYTITQDAGNTTSTTVSGLTPSATYFCALQAINAQGVGSALSSEITFTLPASGRLNVSFATASAHDGNVPANTLDNDPNTRWSAEGAGQWISFDLGAVRNVDFLMVSWYLGASRVSTFDVLVSNDAANWVAIATGLKSSGTTSDLERVELPDTPARYVRIVGQGNSVNAWNSIIAVEIWGLAGPIHIDELIAPTIAISAAGVSVKIRSVPGRRYRLQTSDTLESGDWETIDGPLDGDGNPIDFVDPKLPLDPKRFYRVMIEP